MGTAWMPLTRFEPKTWLLGTGEVVKEPPLEQTSTGRKIRVIGTSESVFVNDLDDLLTKSVARVAATKNTQILIELTHVKELERRLYADWDPASTPARLHLVHNPTDRGGTTYCWWRFKHPTMPFEALLVATLRNNRSTSAPNQQIQNVYLTLPHRTYHSEGASTFVSAIGDQSFSDITNAVTPLGHSAEYAWREFIRDNPPGWSADLLGTRVHPHQRVGVAEFLKMVHDFESYESIQVPDLSDPYNPAWMTLELYETNVNAELVNDLSEYLDGAPTIEQAVDLYRQMLSALHAAGITVLAKEPNDFLAALLAGEKATMNMEVANLAEENYKIDSDHALSVHLPTGTFVVECRHRGSDPNTIAEKWEEAKTVAALTGEADELLAYARRYAQQDSARRTKKIFAERQIK